MTCQNPFARVAYLPGACGIALLACTASFAAAGAPVQDDLSELRARATARAAQQVVASKLDDATIELFAERAVIRVADAGRISRTKYENLAACAVKSWQVADPAIERELLQLVVDGKLVRGDAMSYRMALSQQVASKATIDSETMLRLEDSSLDAYLPCEQEADQNFSRELEAAQERTRQLLRTMSSTDSHAP